MLRSWHFFLGPYPIKVEYSFFIVVAIYGAMSGSVVRALFFILFAFIGVMAHELGHAYAARRRSQFTSIELNLTGGLTTFFGPRLRRRDLIVIAFAGPLTGLAIGAVAYAIGLAIPSALVDDFVFVNAGWGAMNLLPVLPLDGGRMLQPMVRPRTIAIVSIVTGFTVAALALVADQTPLALFFGSLGAANLRSLRARE